MMMMINESTEPMITDNKDMCANSREPEMASVALEGGAKEDTETVSGAIVISTEHNHGTRKRRRSSDHISESSHLFRMIQDDLREVSRTSTNQDNDGPLFRDCNNREDKTTQVIGSSKSGGLTGPDTTEKSPNQILKHDKNISDIKIASALPSYSSDDIKIAAATPQQELHHEGALQSESSGKESLTMPLPIPSNYPQNLSGQLSPYTSVKLRDSDSGGEGTLNSMSNQRQRESPIYIPSMDDTITATNTLQSQSKVFKHWNNDINNEEGATLASRLSVIEPVNATSAILLPQLDHQNVKPTLNVTDSPKAEVSVMSKPILNCTPIEIDSNTNNICNNSSLLSIKHQSAIEDEKSPTDFYAPENVKIPPLTPQIISSNFPQSSSPEIHEVALLTQDSAPESDTLILPIQHQISSPPPIILSSGRPSPQKRTAPSRFSATSCCSSSSPSTGSESSPTVQLQDKAALVAELKAIKIASITARNNALEAELLSKRLHLEEVTKDLCAPAAETVRRHIKLLHDYNDIRDIGQGLIGMIAEQRGVQVGSLYKDFGVGVRD